MQHAQLILAWTRPTNRWNFLLLWAIGCAVVVAATRLADLLMERRWPCVNDLPAWARDWPVVARVPWLKLTRAFSTVSLGVVLLQLAMAFTVWALNPGSLTQVVVRVFDVLIPASITGVNGCFLFTAWKVPTSRPKDPDAPPTVAVAGAGLGNLTHD